MRLVLILYLFVETNPQIILISGAVEICNELEEGRLREGGSDVRVSFF